MQFLANFQLDYTRRKFIARISRMKPAYLQVKEFIQQHISSGQWRTGDPVPSEATLMQQFGISRMTVNRALSELSAEGLVKRVQGLGTFVAELHRISSNLTIRDVQEEVVERGHVHSARVLLQQAEAASAEVAQALGLAAGAEVFHTVLVHMENGVPIQYEDRFVNPAVSPDYLAVNFVKITPTRHLLNVAPLTEADYAIEAQLPTPEQARYLDIPATEPCLLMRRRTVSGPHVASTARLVYPGTRYHFAGKFQA
jgi:GntR family transcriptional regulator, histidine utilization repressor